MVFFLLALLVGAIISKIVDVVEASVDLVVVVVSSWSSFEVGRVELAGVGGLGRVGRRQAPPRLPRVGDPAASERGRPRRKTTPRRREREHTRDAAATGGDPANHVAAAETCRDKHDDARPRKDERDEHARERGTPAGR